MEVAMAIVIDKFVQFLRSKALPPFGKGKCAMYVRLALEEGGANTTGHPVYAKLYGPILVSNGFSVVKLESPDPARFVAKKGDVAVISPPVSESDPGHIQGYDGRNWISDFIQGEFWPGPQFRLKKPHYVIYRP
jgi:hypothetical protein